MQLFFYPTIFGYVYLRSQNLQQSIILFIQKFNDYEI